MRRPSTHHPESRSVTSSMGKFTFPYATSHELGLNFPKRQRENGLQEFKRDFADRFLRGPPIEVFRAPAPNPDYELLIGGQNCYRSEIQQLALFPEPFFLPRQFQITLGGQ